MAYERLASGLKPLMTGKAWSSMAALTGILGETTAAAAETSQKTQLDTDQWMVLAG